jgi:RNA polymerase sigma-70 factor, ECF subfamily
MERSFRKKRTMATGPSTDPQIEIDERRMIEAAQRDPRLFAALYDLHFERVYAYAVSRLRDRVEAQDLTSEVFHDALRNLAKYEWRGVPFSAWLYRIAAHAIADRANRAAREQKHADDVARHPEAIEDDLEEMERRARIFRSVTDLPADQRRVIQMRFVEERSIRDIAKELGRSEGAIKQLQFRALQSLRDRLGERNG